GRAIRRLRRPRRDGDLHLRGSGPVRLFLSDPPVDEGCHHRRGIGPTSTFTYLPRSHTMAVYVIGGRHMANEDLPPILDAAQVADLLGMNVQMVRRYAREGRLPAY